MDSHFSDSIIDDVHREIATRQREGPPDNGENNDKVLAPGPFDVIAHGGWKTGSVSSAEAKEGPPSTGDNDKEHLAPGPFDVMAHGKWKTGTAS